ncbi:MAG: LPXTG cell wall anchor domain-containing protein, partial [Methanosarcina thermophila]
TIEFDVANTHPNEFNSVSIKPEAEGIRFYPAEYFIGPMNPDELFTIEFTAVADDSWNPRNEEGANMSLTANYNNGINRHVNTVGNLNFTSVSGSTESSPKAVLAGGLIIIAVPAAFLFYRRRKK